MGAGPYVSERKTPCGWLRPAAPVAGTRAAPGSCRRRRRARLPPGSRAPPPLWGCREGLQGSQRGSLLLKNKSLHWMTKKETKVTCRCNKSKNGKYKQTLFQSQKDSVLRDPHQTRVKGKTGGDHLRGRNVVWRMTTKWTSLVRFHWFRCDPADRREEKG